jgi:glycosyltransferase involved in cell wall biosynthesis
VRLLHLISNLLSGGAQQQLSYLASELVRSGAEVHIGYFRPGPKRALLERTGAELHPLSAGSNSAMKLLWEISRLVRRLAPDLVQTWLLQMDIAGGLAAVRHGRTWILSERASEEHWTETGGAEVRLRALLGRRADAIASNSRTGDAYWRSRTGSGVLRRIIPNAVPLDQIEVTAQRPEALGDVPAGRKVVLSVGRISPEKNVEGLVAALALVGRRLPVTAFLCGDGTHEAETRRLVDRLGVGSDVRLVGYSDDVWGWMKHADVFVSVSRTEGHPNAVLEAAACGCPLVLSDIPSHRDMLTESEALFVDGGSPVAIADGLEFALRDPAEARRRAAAAHKRVGDLSVSRMAGAYSALYEDALARRAAREAR